MRPRRIHTTCQVIAALVLSAATAVAAPGERKAYDLRYRPVVGQRWAYEQSTDSALDFEGGIDRANVRTATREVRHSQLIVKCDETLEVTGGQCTAKRVTFGKGCFSFEQVDDRPRRDHRLVYSEKTVTFRVLPDGTLEQDFGVEANGRHMRLLRDSILGRETIFPGYPVAIGDRWRCDDVMREIMQLTPDDIFSTIFTLQRVREQDGRQLADIGVTAAVMMSERGMKLETGIEGTYVVDVATGVPVKIDLIGKISVAGAGPRGARVSGGGTFEFHRAARLLPPASPQTAEAK